MADITVVVAKRVFSADPSPLARGIDGATIEGIVIDAQNQFVVTMTDGRVLTFPDSLAPAAVQAASNAQIAADSAAAILAIVNSVYDAFDDLYLGPKAVEPTLDNDGDPLVDGAFFFHTTVGSIKFWAGTHWRDDALVATHAAEAAVATGTLDGGYF